MYIQPDLIDRYLGKDTVALRTDVRYLEVTKGPGVIEKYVYCAIFEKKRDWRFAPRYPAEAS